MPASRRVEGRPYSATFLEDDGLYDVEDDSTFAWGVIEPPFSRAKELIKANVVPGTSVRDHATTATKTVLGITVEKGTSDRTREARLEAAYETLASIVKELNDIENGTGPFREE